MQLTITLEQLKQAEACEEAVVAFRDLFGASATAEWTREKQLEILRGPLGKHLGWTVWRGLLPLLAMDGANLVGANLVGASLDGANLVGARLDGARLDWASLVGARLDRASLDRARLVWAKVCLCNSVPCVSLRELLAANGWIVGSDGLLSAAPQLATVGERK